MQAGQRCRSERFLLASNGERRRLRRSLSRPVRPAVRLPRSTFGVAWSLIEEVRLKDQPRRLIPRGWSLLLAGRANSSAAEIEAPRRPILSGGTLHDLPAGVGARATGADRNQDSCRGQTEYGQPHARHSPSSCAQFRHDRPPSLRHICCHRIIRRAQPRSIGLTIHQRRRPASENMPEDVVPVSTDTAI
jgi:hypothetical protein